VIRHRFVKKKTYIRYDELERITTVLNNNYEKMKELITIQNQKIDSFDRMNPQNNTFSQLANNTNNNQFSILERVSNEGNINKIASNNNDSERINNSWIPLSSQESTDRLMKLFERVRPKYLFPLEPKFEAMSEVESSKFIRFEPNLSKINCEPPISLIV
jgi:hypothetical protein